MVSWASVHLELKDDTNAEKIEIGLDCVLLKLKTFVI